MTVSATIVLRGRGVVGGRAEGEALVTREAIPGWGGVNPQQGVITETHHELRGKSFKDKVLVFRGATDATTRSPCFTAASISHGSGPEFPMHVVHPYPTVWNPSASRSAVNLVRRSVSEGVA